MLHHVSQLLPSKTILLQNTPTLSFFFLSFYEIEIVLRERHFETVENIEKNMTDMLKALKRLKHFSTATKTGAALMYNYRREPLRRGQYF